MRIVSNISSEFVSHVLRDIILILLLTVSPYLLFVRLTMPIQVLMLELR